MDWQASQEPRQSPSLHLARCALAGPPLEENWDGPTNGSGPGEESV